MQAASLHPYVTLPSQALDPVVSEVLWDLYPNAEYAPLGDLGINERRIEALSGRRLPYYRRRSGFIAPNPTPTPDPEEPAEPPPPPGSRAVYEIDASYAASSRLSSELQAWRSTFVGMCVNDKNNLQQRPFDVEGMKDLKDLRTNKVFANMTMALLALTGDRVYVDILADQLNTFLSGAAVAQPWQLWPSRELLPGHEERTENNRNRPHDTNAKDKRFGVTGVNTIIDRGISWDSTSSRKSPAYRRNEGKTWFALESNIRRILYLNKEAQAGILATYGTDIATLEESLAYAWVFAAGYILDLNRAYNNRFDRFDWGAIADDCWSVKEGWELKWSRRGGATSSQVFRTNANAGGSNVDYYRGGTGEHVNWSLLHHANLTRARQNHVLRLWNNLPHRGNSIVPSTTTRAAHRAILTQCFKSINYATMVNTSAWHADYNITNWRDLEHVYYPHHMTGANSGGFAKMVYQDETTSEVFQLYAMGSDGTNGEKFDLRFMRGAAHAAGLVWQDHKNQRTATFTGRNTGRTRTCSPNNKARAYYNNDVEWSDCDTRMSGGSGTEIGGYASDGGNWAFVTGFDQSSSLYCLKQFNWRRENIGVTLNSITSAPLGTQARKWSWTAGTLLVGLVSGQNRPSTITF